VPSVKEVECNIKAIEIGVSISSTEAIINQDEIMIVEKLRAKVDAEVQSGKSQELKAAIINYAIKDIEIGLYQWKPFALCGSGWVCDNIWCAVMPTLLPQLVLEFNLKKGVEGYTILVGMVGLAIGAPLWGIVGDTIGRRGPFDLTPLVAGIFGITIAFSPSSVALCAFAACVGVGVGGSLPIDAALFVESSQRRTATFCRL
jgi:Na+/melibiose symporter-like transporter